jgi:hypothetical protein
VVVVSGVTVDWLVVDAVDAVVVLPVDWVVSVTVDPVVVLSGVTVDWLVVDWLVAVWKKSREGYFISGQCNIQNAFSFIADVLTYLVLRSSFKSPLSLEIFQVSFY